ncbi:MAG TPA: hypothetical protein PK299_03255 [Anaerolineales bacterium]|nr:hypothetical protein [Anaerolineales bacterium]
MPPTPPTTKVHRSKSVTFLALLVLFLACQQLWGAWLITARQDWYISFPLSLPWQYLLWRSVVWGLLLLISTALLFTQQRRWYRSLFWLSVFYALHFWADRLLLQKSDFVQAVLGWDILIFFLLFGLALWTLWSNQTTSNVHNE